LAILGAALAFVWLAHLLVPTPGSALGLVLILLGTAAGLVAYLADGEARRREGPILGRVSPRGWVSLGLLTLAAGVLAITLAGSWTPREAAEGRLPGPDARPAATRATGELAEARRRLADKQSELESWKKTWNYIPDSPGPQTVKDREEARAARLAVEVEDLRAEVARMEAKLKKARSGSPPRQGAIAARPAWNGRAGGRYAGGE
jgi:hypothetical protein